jgi:uncharacterized protein involved in exopolysaccharide biosynthesis
MMNRKMAQVGWERPSGGGATGELRVVQAAAVSTEFEPDTVFDVSAALVKLRKHWLALLLLLVVGGASGYGVSYLITPKYQVETLLTLVSDEQSGGGLKGLGSQYGALASLAGVDLSGADHTRSATIAMLKSHRFTEQFIADQQLMPYIVRRIRSKSANGQLSGDPPTLQECADVFIKKALTVNEDRKTGLVTLRIEWFDRQEIAGWANALVAKANAVNRALAIQNADDSVSYLNKELAHADTVDIRQSIYALLESQMNKRMLAITRPEFSFRVIDPAQTPRIKDRVSPNRVLLAFAGGVVLFGLGCLVILARNPSKAGPDEQ